MKQLSLLVMMLSISANVFAEEFEIDGLRYDLDTYTKVVKVIKYKNKNFYSGNVVIPETVEHMGTTYSVTGIGNDAFYFCSNLTSVTIPNSVTAIGDYAFDGCSNLPSISIPNSVKYIGDYAFWGCTGLTHFTIPNEVTYIGRHTFHGCSRLINIVIPDKVTKIGEYAFYECFKLQKIIIPVSVQYIYQEAFSRSGLTEIVAQPEMPPFIYDDTFSNYNCTLKVPEAGKDAYKSHEVWGQFKTIQTIDVTSISQAPAQAVLIQSEGGVLTVQGLDDGQQVRVYGIDGTEAGAAVSSNGQATVGTNLKPGSVAIIKIGDRSVKVVVK